MKLIGSLASPYVRKVRIVMAEKKLDYDFVLDNVWAADTPIQQSNALGKVPCLIMEDGGAMFDSRVIVEYLDTLTPVCKLIPVQGRERAEVKCWEALADGVADAAILVRLEKTQREAEHQSASWTERQMGAVDLEHIWRGRTRDFHAWSALTTRRIGRSLFTIQRLGEDARDRSLAHAARAGEQIRVVDTLQSDRVAQRAHDRVLPNDFTERLRPVFAREDDVHRGALRRGIR